MARISLRTEGPFATNSYIIDEGDGKCILVDAPAPSIAQAITELGLEVDEVWLTHGHFDHIFGLAFDVGKKLLLLGLQRLFPELELIVCRFLLFVNVVDVDDNL